MDFLANFIKGIFIGAGAIIPGISSGVLCVIFGIYEKLLNSVLNFFKDIKHNFIFLFPIGIGCGFGIFLFGNLLNYFLYKFPIQTRSLFIGFILSNVFCLLKKINSNNKFKVHYIFYFIFTLLLGISMVILEKHISLYSVQNINYLYLIFCGFSMSIGVVVPGVSSTIILMILGIYSIYLYSISNLFLPILIPIFFGLSIGCIIFMKIIKYFLDTHYIPTFFAIIGFTIGSIFVLLPNYSSFIDLLISLLYIVLSFYISLSINSLNLLHKNT